MRALQIALGIACLAVVYAGLAPVLRASAVEARDGPADRSPRCDGLEPRALPRDRRAQPVPHARRRAGRGPVDEELKESALRLKLCGTYAAQPTERSVACIDDQSTQKRRAFRVGQEVSPGVRLIAVERRRAVIDNRGAREQLTMEESCRAPARSRPPRAGAPRGARRGRDRRGTPRISERLRQLRERAPEPAEAAPRRRPPPSCRPRSTARSSRRSTTRAAASAASACRASSRAARSSACPRTPSASRPTAPSSTARRRCPSALVSNADGQLCLRCRQPDGAETTRCL